MSGPIFPRIALYSPYPSLLKYTIGFLPRSFNNREIMNVYGEIEIIRYLESSIFEAATADEMYEKNY